MKHVEVVCALIENEEGKIFCCKRGPGRALEGYWEFPGGKVEAHETHEETIVREIKEELKYAYRCKLVKGNLELTEHVEKAWKTKDEMKNMNFAEADKVFII